MDRDNLTKCKLGSQDAARCHHHRPGYQSIALIGPVVHIFDLSWLLRSKGSGLIPPNKDAIAICASLPTGLEFRFKARNLK